MDNHQQPTQPGPEGSPSPDEHRPAPHLPLYTPPRITSYSDAEILAALGPAQTGGYAGKTGATSWF